MACGCLSKLYDRQRRISHKLSTFQLSLFPISLFHFSWQRRAGVGVQDSQGIARCNGVLKCFMIHSVIHSSIFAYFTCTFANAKCMKNRKALLERHCATSTTPLSRFIRTMTLTHFITILARWSWSLPPSFFFFFSPSVSGTGIRRRFFNLPYFLMYWYESEITV